MARVKGLPGQKGTQGSKGSGGDRGLKGEKGEAATKGERGPAGIPGFPVSLSIMFLSCTRVFIFCSFPCFFLMFLRSLYNSVI